MTWPLVGAVCNFTIRTILFIASPRPLSRGDILNIVLSGVFLSTIPMQAATKSLAKSHLELSNMQARMVDTEGKIVSVLEKGFGASTPSPTQHD